LGVLTVDERLECRTAGRHLCPAERGIRDRRSRRRRLVAPNLHRGLALAPPTGR
jgi:hypothetical protein